jgi:enoyl-CoA hydratase/carnithine racemase
MTDHIQLRLDEGVLIVSIDRPAKKNAITAEMYAALAQAVSQADPDERVRVVLLRGEEGNFTSGNDVGVFLAIGDGEQPESPALPFIRAVIALRKPTVASVRGHAMVSARRFFSSSRQSARSRLLIGSASPVDIAQHAYLDRDWSVCGGRSMRV